jgi:CRP-like cAMP-binding protein
MLDFDLTTSRGSLDSALDEETIGRLADRYERICFPADKIVFQEGEEGDRLYVILRGEMVVLKDMGWGPRELKRARDGEVVGEMSMITGARRTATVRAVRETECVQLGREEFQKLVESDTGFARQMMRMLSERLARSDDRAMEELLNSHRALIFALAEQADSRDPETGAHLQRTRHYCARLSELLLTHPRFEGRVGPGFVESIFHLSPLHDIGTPFRAPDAWSALSNTAGWKA